MYYALENSEKTPNSDKFNNAKLATVIYKKMICSFSDISVVYGF